MTITKIFIFFLMAITLIGTVSADGLSVQLKRTNPGIAGSKPAELIFDVVNTDLNHKIEGFIWCRSPDDTTVSSTLGASTGSGAQYVSDRFFMDTGPTQKAISLVLESADKGDKNAGCILKYIPFKEAIEGGEQATKKIEFKGTIGQAETNVEGYKVKMSDYKEVQEEVEEDGQLVDQTVPSSVKVYVNNIPKEIKIGDEERISDLFVKVFSATAESADVEINGEVSLTQAGTAVKKYKKTNGEYIQNPVDDNYRELRLDKTVPFVKASPSADVNCPEGKTTCNANEVQVSNGGFLGIPTTWILAILGVIVLSVVYLLGRTYRRD